MEELEAEFHFKINYIENDYAINITSLESKLKGS